ncbi:hypothetical protein [Chitinophaga deserti]|uniref:hypothetical protein n=1 Tax=Chitinophaga deserti TaxID=2164099 RepID=UPI000D6C2826|nr:hypothetical protein [Chitinophaga deserti]
MPQSANNFHIAETPVAVELWFHKQFRHWFDLCCSLIFTACAAWITWLIFRNGVSVLSWGPLVLGGFLIFATFLLAADTISRLIVPSGRMLWIDKQARSITIRPSIFQTRTYPLKEVSQLTSGNRSVRISFLHYMRKPVPRTLRLRLKNGTTVNLAHLSTTNIINLGNRHPRMEAIKQAKKVAVELNRHIQLLNEGAAFVK